MRRLKAEIANGVVITITKHGCDKCDRGVEEVTFDTIDGNNVSVQTLTGKAAELVWAELEVQAICRSSTLLKEYK